jgi:hypothetical protein
MSSVTKSDISSLIEQLHDLITKRDISSLIEKLLEESKPCESYKEPIKAMLAIATFAGAITFSIILTPRDNPTHAIKELAYANSLFFVVIMGCVLIIVSIEVTADLVVLEKKVKDVEGTLRDKGVQPTWENLRSILSPIDITVVRHFRRVRPFIERFLIPFWVGIVGAMQFTAFYLMLHASLLFLHYNGPFIFGTVLYVTIGVLTFLMWFFGLYVKSGVGLGERLVSEMELTESRMRNTEKKMENTVSEMKHTENKMENTVSEMKYTENKMENTVSEMKHTESKMENTESKMEHTEIKMEELAKEMMKLANELVAIIKKSTKEKEGSAG